MKIHEYQAKELLGAYGAPVPPGEVAATVEQAAAAAEKYGRCVLKAQVHSGGRGKAGGVKLAENADEARAIAGEMLGMRLKTNQTGPEGKLVRKLLVTPAVEVKKEFYLSVTGDHENACLVIIASADGGTEIEETARTHPERIARVPVSAVEGFKRYEGLQVSGVLGLTGENEKDLISLLDSMTRLYREKDCSLVEINPLVLTVDGQLICLDAKVTFDDNALFRHPDLKELRDTDEEDPREYRASQYDLNFVSLSGSIGCLVNGAGLAMAPMDIIQHFGGEPANFLDVGGSASKEKVQAAFELLLSDENVRAIFVNIFGGIMKCDVIAEGVVAAAREMGISIPLIVRLEGTNVELGKQILAASNLKIIAAENMADGARKAVEAAAWTGGDGA